ncbi:predicted ORF [Xanthomonas phage XacN1]|nr:predicted ORF [Xanthomonas phage XacN1]BBA65701.1 predicted ORF [Xanthomonas phage XacN1]
MSSSDAAFREKFMKLMQSRKEMSPEQLTSEDEFDNMVELGDATE